MHIHSFDVVGFADDELAAEERLFDPWRTPCTPAAGVFVQTIIKMLEGHEKLHGLRQRKRRVADQAMFERMVSAIACDLALAVLLEGPKVIFIGRSHQELGHSSRYGSPASSKTLTKILDLLATQQLGLIKMELGYRTVTGDRKKTSIRPSSKFCHLVHDFALSASDIAECQRPEPIELKSFPPCQGKKAQLIDYKDTDRTNNFRLEMHEINGHLIAARIDYTGSAVARQSV
ncbi:hypothetical protein FAZ78_23250 [Cereibacter changlensis]|uniref:Uncharacterized protein n=1 Tax=Cereibacter changlensis TaxID=402884 RepID=A0A4U0YUU2_9RHOB|nr:hypothetical protein [Cereibacter changlensis]TKA94266.1 hypothetical protein FAZ78_23250 [Cereibacter changlensis]